MARHFERRFLLLVAVLCLTALVATTAGAAEAARPNIVLILSDDMGYSDIGCYGGEIETPNLDRLAANGLRFTQFYNTGRCCPTRASLMTGLYPHQAGVGHMMGDRGVPGYRGNLNRHCVTIAEVLGRAGYATYMAGKWHLTRHTMPKDEKLKFNWPLQRGFDRFFGTIRGGGSYFDPTTLTRGNTPIAPEDPDAFYYTDAIADNASKFVKEHPGDKPFFLYVAFTAAHWPLHAKPEDIAKYEGRYDKGWDQLRAERYRRQVEMGLIQSQWKLTEHVRPWEKVKHKDWFARRMEVYAAMVDCMDQGVGRIVAALEAKGQLDNTLILFLQDNGGCQEELRSLRPVRPDPDKPVKPRPMKPGELQTRMIPKVTRDGRPVRQGFGVMPGPADTYMTYGIEWANASNTPFRMYKHFVHEGGISTPLIAHWPAGIEDRNEFRNQPGHLIDIMATCVDLARAEYPTTYEGEKIYPMEGRSLSPAFENRPLEREAIYWEHEGNRAVRVGKWKLVAKGARGPWELYDIIADRSETNDLAEKYAERVKEMADLYDRWAVRAHVVPNGKKKKE